MKFSVRSAARKWSCGPSGCDQWPVAVLAAALMVVHAAALTANTVGRAIPLPRPRPAEAPATGGKPAGEKPAEEKPADDEQPAAQAPPSAPALSACRLALTDSIAIAPSVPAITGPGGCGGTDLVRLEAVVLPDNKGRVAVKPAAVLRCTMASAVADWIRTDMAPLAEARGSKLNDLDNFDSFECRGRNRVVGAQLSEHGRANALDVRSLKLANGASIALTDRSVPREVRETVLHSVCARFTTVLGPGSDGYHEDHIHLDLAERRNGYRICQWDVWDPLPLIAPLLPPERPEEAPPRQVAAKADGEPAAARATAETAAPPAAAESAKAAESAEPPATDQPKPTPKPKSAAKPKPRRHHAAPQFFNLFR